MDCAVSVLGRMAQLALAPESIVRRKFTILKQKRLVTLKREETRLENCQSEKIRTETRVDTSRC